MLFLEDNIKCLTELQKSSLFRQNIVKLFAYCYLQSKLTLAKKYLGETICQFYCWVLGIKTPLLGGTWTEAWPHSRFVSKAT